MKIETQDYLRLVEAANTLAFVDIEATGLRGDYNSVLVVSVKPYKGKPTTFHIEQAGNDQRVVREAKQLLESYDCWTTYYGKGFDIPMLNTRLLKWKVNPIARRHHIDLFFTLKYNLLTARKSQAHLLEWLETPEKKMTVGADVWNSVVRNEPKAMATMIKRCESDVKGLQQLYENTKHLIKEIKTG